jgi:hypothetical protein
MSAAAARKGAKASERKHAGGYLSGVDGGRELAVAAAAAARAGAVEARPERLHLGLLALHARAPLLAQPLVPPPHVLLVPLPPAGRVPGAAALLLVGAAARDLGGGLRHPLGEPALVPFEVALQLGRLRPQVVRGALGSARCGGCRRRPRRHGRRRRPRLLAAMIPVAARGYVSDVAGALGVGGVGFVLGVGRGRGLEPAGAGRKNTLAERELGRRVSRVAAAGSAVLFGGSCGRRL